MSNDTYYLAGPMTGYPEFNIPAFKKARQVLEEQGVNVKLPFDIDNEQVGWDWGQYLAEDIKIICKCQGIILMPGWQRSRGAKLEVAAGLMQSLKLPFSFYLYNPNDEELRVIAAWAIADQWHRNWDVYSKEAGVAA